MDEPSLSIGVWMRVREAPYARLIIASFLVWFGAVSFTDSQSHHLPNHPTSHLSATAWASRWRWEMNEENLVSRSASVNDWSPPLLTPRSGPEGRKARRIRAKRCRGGRLGGTSLLVCYSPLFGSCHRLTHHPTYPPRFPRLSLTLNPSGTERMREPSEWGERRVGGDVGAG